jgi:hypothetical protein
MTPTPRLRFVERFVPVIGTNYGSTVRVLQQWWQVASTGQITTNGEWRDVPVEKKDV